LIPDASSVPRATEHAVRAASTVAKKASVRGKTDAWEAEAITTIAATNILDFIGPTLIAALFSAKVTVLVSAFLWGV
jgi:hypothetical protein